MHACLFPAVSEIVRLVEDGERKKNRPVENRDKVSSLMSISYISRVSAVLDNPGKFLNLKK